MVDAKKKGQDSEARVFDHATLTQLACLCATFSFIAGMILSTNGVGSTFAAGLAGAVAVFWTLFQMLRLEAVWMRYQEALKARTRDRSPEQDKRIEHGFIEFFVYLIVSLGGLAAIAYVSSSGTQIGALDLRVVGDTTNPLHLAAFLSALVIAFVPLISGFVRQAYVETPRERVLRGNVVSDLSFWTTAIVVAGLVGLAWAAAGEMFTMEEDFGVFITFLVLLVFFVIILAPHVMRIFNNWTEERDAVLLGARSNSFTASLKPGAVVSYLDSMLVRFIAPLSGATQHGPVWFTPHLLVLLVILPLSALGYVLAAPWGLIPILIAMLIAVSLGRRWAWVEEDRETASRLRTTKGREIAIGFDNDLKDEALLGYASLFILVPLALHQLQGWTNSFVYDPQFSSNNAFFDWLRFFGAELAKAVPFVDWWEIYNVDIQTPYNAALSEDPIAKHLTFAARAMVDLVIMAALFQAIGLWQRSRADRRFYEAGEMDVFDPFTETAFFERGMRPAPAGAATKYVPKPKFERLVRAHVKKREERNWDGNPYSPRRLSELVKSENEDVKAGARWMVDEFGVLVGTPIEQLRSLALLLEEHASSKLRRSVDDRSFARKQKLELERILQELQDDPDSFRDADVPVLVEAFEAIRSVPEFTYAQLQAVQLLRKRPTRRSTHALFKSLMQTRHFNTTEGRVMWDQFKLELGSARSIFIDHFQSRMDVLQALAEHGFEYFGVKNKELLREVIDFIDWMGQETEAKYGTKGDKSKAVRELAREIESKLRTLLRM